MPIINKYRSGQPLEVVKEQKKSWKPFLDSMNEFGLSTEEKTFSEDHIYDTLVKDQLRIRMEMEKQKWAAEDYYTPSFATPTDIYDEDVYQQSILAPQYFLGRDVETSREKEIEARISLFSQMSVDDFIEFCDDNDVDLLSPDYNKYSDYYNK
jgi:hypothetical protein